MPRRRWAALKGRLAKTAEILQPALLLVRESADAFPPLKSVTGGAVHLLQLGNLKQETLDDWNTLENDAQFLAHVIGSSRLHSAETHEKATDCKRFIEEVPKAAQKSRKRLKGLKSFLFVEREAATLYKYSTELKKKFEHFEKARDMHNQSNIQCIHENIVTIQEGIGTLQTGVAVISNKLAAVQVPSLGQNLVTNPKLASGTFPFVSLPKDQIVVILQRRDLFFF